MGHAFLPKLGRLVAAVLLLLSVLAGGPAAALAAAPCPMDAAAMTMPPAAMHAGPGAPDKPMVPACCLAACVFCAVEGAAVQPAPSSGVAAAPVFAIAESGAARLPAAPPVPPPRMG